jgi:hypothetical protein
MLLNILLLIVFAAVVGFCFVDGLCGNALRLVNVVTAGLLAMSFFEPLAGFFQDFFPSYQYFADFISLWLVFTFSMGLLTLVTDQVRREPVRFPPIIERAGAGLFVAWVGWVMVCFTLTTLHAAPLPRNFLFGAFQPEQRMFFGLAPDRKWLAFTQRMSQGAWSRATFDPEGEFMVKYMIRRADLEKQANSTGTLRTP